MTLRGAALGAAWKLTGLLFVLAVVFNWFGVQDLVVAVFIALDRALAALIARVLRAGLPS